MNKPFVLSDAEAQQRGFTADEFMRMVAVGAFEDMKAELVDGSIVRMSPAHALHARVHATVVGQLFQSFGSKRVYIDAALRLGERTVRAFDVTILNAGAKPQDYLVPVDVTFGVEVAVSSLGEDLGRKQRDYAAAGIPLYWVVDAAARVTHVMREPTADGYSDRSLVRFEDGLVLPEGRGELILA